MKDILNLIPTSHAVSLVNENIKKSKEPTKDMINLGMKNIVGINLIKVESGLIAGI